jgi:3-oxoacyl-[acyl-carrier protein] reductase
VGALEGRTAVVTGGSRGIGRAIVERLVEDGARVVFSFVENQAAAREFVDTTAGRAVAVRADQGEASDISRLFEEAGELDILVNNAAINPVTPILDITETEYDQVMRVNAKGTFLTIQQAGRRLRDAGRIINISTLNTVLPAPGIALYAASKAAVEQFTAVAAREFGPRGITVNTVSPGATDTDLLRSSNPGSSFAETIAVTALRRLGRPDDIANVVAFLAGPDSQWITGQNLRVTGGLML